MWIDSAVTDVAALTFGVSVMPRWPKGYKGSDAVRHAANMRRVKAGQSGCAVIPIGFLTIGLTAISQMFL
jgi:hypothetical protein